MSEASAKLALTMVLWDGAGEDGCPFCSEGFGESPDTEDLILHDPVCPIVVHRLELIGNLVGSDPSPESPEGKQLVELAGTQERYELATRGNAGVRGPT